MIEIKIFVKKIDYKTSIEKTFPRILEHIEHDEKMRYIHRTLKRMGENSTELACSVSSYLSVRDKNMILCEVLNQYRERLIEKTDALIRKIQMCEKMQVQDVKFEVFKGRPVLVMEVKDNSDDVLSKLLKTTTIFVLNQESVKQNVLMHIKSALRAEGIVVVLDNLVVEKRTQRDVKNSHVQKETMELSEKSREKISDAIAEYLSDMVELSKNSQVDDKENDKK